jgi:acyl-CoA synthetase (AMP-forming)/AMP-acid ligase II/peptidoglycan/LPS O-acetylase OafA/YrhL
MTGSTLALRMTSVPRDRLAAIDENGSITYGELLDRAAQIALQIGPEKELVILSCETSIDWLTAYTAVLIGGHAAFLVAPDALAFQATLTSTFQATVAMSAVSNFRPERLLNNRPALDPNLSILLSTSGSTGSPKCVRLSNENLASNAESIATYLELDATERGVVSLPVQYSYGLSIVNSHLWAGATILMTQRSLIEPEFWAFCNQHGATSFAGVPHSYDLLSRIDFAAIAPSTLRYFTQAGGRLAPDHVRSFAKIAQTHGWRFYVMYGQTEASPRMAFLPPKEIDQHIGSIGIAIPGGKLTVRDQDNQILAPDEEGELVYEGQNVMMGYAYGVDDLALGQGPRELHTGDLARQSEDGFFYITGRMSRFVKIYGNRIGLDETETICAAAGFSAIATGTDQKLLVVTRTSGDEEKIRKLLSAKLGLPAMTIEVRLMDEYPILATGKIDYAALKATITQDDLLPNEGRKSVKDVYRQVFGTAAEDGSLSFFDLGGDSLTYVRVSLDLENLFGAIPENWHRMPADALEEALATKNFAGSDARPTRKDLLGNLDTVRTLACVLVVAVHVLGDDPGSGLQIPETSDWRLPFEILDLLRMPLFTALAGLLYASMSGMHDGLIGFIRRRFITLMVPAIVLSLFYYELRTVMGKTGPPLDLLRYGYLHFWYLYALFQIAVAVAVIDKVLRPSVRGWLVIILCGFVIAHTAPFSPLSGALYLAPYYVLGIVVARSPAILHRKSIIGTAVVISVLGMMAEAVIFYRPETVVPFLRPIASVALVLTVLRFMPRIHSIEWIGIYSYAIYLWHPAVNSAVRTVLTKIIGNDYAILFSAGLLAGVFVPILMHRVVNRWPAVLRIPVIGS